MRLDLVAATWDAIDDALDASAGEVTLEIQSMLDAVHLDEREGVDSAILSIRALEADCEKWKNLEAEFAAKRRRAEDRIVQRKAWVKAYMQQRDTKHLPGDFWAGFKLVASGKPPVEVLVAPEDLPRPYTTVIVTPNKEALRDGLTRGLLPPGLARFGDATISVRIY